MTPSTLLRCAGVFFFFFLERGRGSIVLIGLLVLLSVCAFVVVVAVVRTFVRGSRRWNTGEEACRRCLCLVLNRLAEIPSARSLPPPTPPTPSLLSLKSRLIRTYDHSVYYRPLVTIHPVVGVRRSVRLFVCLFVGCLTPVAATATATAVSRFACSPHPRGELRQGVPVLPRGPGRPEPPHELRAVRVGAPLVAGRPHLRGFHPTVGPFQPPDPGTVDVLLWSV